MRFAATTASTPTPRRDGVAGRFSGAAGTETALPWLLDRGRYGEMASSPTPPKLGGAEGARLLGIEGTTGAAVTGTAAAGTGGGGGTDLRGDGSGGAETGTGRGVVCCCCGDMIAFAATPGMAGTAGTGRVLAWLNIGIDDEC